MLNSLLSYQFPRCDGSHTQHNKETGDNVGPVVLKRKKPAAAAAAVAAAAAAAAAPST